MTSAPTGSASDAATTVVAPGGEQRVLAVITDPPVVRAILIAIGRDPEPPQRSGPRAPPGELFSI